MFLKKEATCLYAAPASGAVGVRLWLIPAYWRMGFTNHATDENPNSRRVLDCGPLTFYWGW